MVSLSNHSDVAISHFCFYPLPSFPILLGIHPSLPPTVILNVVKNLGIGVVVSSPFRKGRLRGFLLILSPRHSRENGNPGGGVGCEFLSLDGRGKGEGEVPDIIPEPLGNPVSLIW